MIGFDFNLKLNFGQITDLQSKKITEILADTEYENVASTPVFKIFDDKKGSQIIINTEQFTFKISREYEHNELETFAILCKKIMEALLDSSKAEFANVRLVNVFESPNLNTALVLKEKSNFNFNESALEDISAIGYRFLMKKGNLYDEIKVEPLIMDTKKMFIEGLFNRAGIVAENVEEYIKTAYDEYSKKADYFTKLSK